MYSKMEIKFKRDTSFRKQFFVPDSFAHPAKMDAQLLIWIVEHYTEAGETILDPMAGSGTTMLACTLGRNVILVELEEKFCKMMRDNWEQVKMRPQLGSTMGECQIILGDARQLEGLVDKIVTSPPYAETLQGSGADAARKRISEGRYKGLRPDVWTSKGNIAGSTFGDGYSRDPNNISNLPYGEIDKCIFSPPYAEAHNKEPGGVTKADRKDLLDYSYLKEDNPDNVGNLPYGQIDKIVTSPPYEGSFTHSEQDPEKRFERLKEVDRESVKKGDKWAITSDEALRRRLAQQDGGYGSREENIGNLKSDSYLEAMLQVYQQCFAVLRDGGLMVLVTKNFIRNKQVIRLDEDTIKLCEQAGFGFVERHYRELPSQSFWRIIYHKKYPDVEKIEYEDVLVFRK